jgi:hypothetical protein
MANATHAHLIPHVAKRGEAPRHPHHLDLPTLWPGARQCICLAFRRLISAAALVLAPHEMRFGPTRRHCGALTETQRSRRGTIAGVRTSAYTVLIISFETESCNILGMYMCRPWGIVFVHDELVMSTMCATALNCVRIFEI